MAKSKSSKRWLREHHDDSFVQKARELGYRSRAVFKLDEIQRKDRLFVPGQWVLDLGAAPGGWSEYATRMVGDRGRVIALDLLDLEPIAGVEIIRGDFTEQATLDALLARIGDRKVDLVFSDMAPNFSGVESIDQPRAMVLGELAFDLAREYLAADGALVIKLFQGQGFDELISALRRGFQSVKLRKPEASRSRSKEIYAVCRGLK